MLTIITCSNSTTAQTIRSIDNALPGPSPHITWVDDKIIDGTDKPIKVAIYDIPGVVNESLIEHYLTRIEQQGVDRDLIHLEAHSDQDGQFD